MALSNTGSRSDNDERIGGDTLDNAGARPLDTDEHAQFDQIAAGVNNPDDYANEPTGPGPGMNYRPGGNISGGDLTDHAASDTGTLVSPRRSPGTASNSAPGASTSPLVPGLAKSTPGGNKPWYARAKNQARIGLILVAVLITIVGYVLYIPFEIIHIAQVLWHHHSDRSTRTEDRAAKKVWQRLFGEKQNELGGYQFRTGHIIADKFHNSNLKKLDQRFKNAGVEPVYDSTGKKFVGFKDIESGELVSNFADKNIFQKQVALFKAIHDYAGTRNPIIEAYYTKLARTQFGVSFKFWTERAAGTKIIDLLKKLYSKVRLGVAGDVALDVASHEPDPKDKAAHDAWQAEMDKLNAQHDNLTGVSDAAKAVNDEYNKSYDIKKALNAGKAIFANKWFKAGGIGIGIVTFYCMIQKMVNDNLASRTITLTDELIREGDMPQTQAHQAEAGNLYGQEFNDMLQRYEGDPKADPNKSEDAKDFTQACSWKRATGKECSTDPKDYKNYNPDLSPDANPSPAAVSGILALIDNIFNIPGSGVVCAVLNSTFGWIIQGVALVASVVTGPISAVAGLIQGAILTYATEEIVPIVLKMLTNLSVTGTENPVGLVNNESAGTALSVAALDRASGSIPLGPKDLGALNDATNADIAKAAQQKGWTYRTFALDNTNSLASRMLDDLPLSPQAAVSGLSSTVRNFVPNLATIFSTVALGEHRALAATTNQCEFGWACYGTTDADIDKYDVIDNENFLAAPVQKPDGTMTSRLEMLGDPSTHKPTDPDLPKTGLLYCFVNKYEAPPADPNAYTDPVCKDLDILTPTTPNKTTFNLPGEKEIEDIYCKQNQVCTLPYNDDFTRYRMEIKYYLHATAIYGYTIDTDPWQ